MEWQDGINHFGKLLSFTRYEVRGNILYIREGFLSRVEQQVYLYNISSIELVETLTNRIFGQGDLHLVIDNQNVQARAVDNMNTHRNNLMNEVGFNYVLHNIKDARRVRDELNEARLQAMKEYRVSIGQSYAEFNPMMNTNYMNNYGQPNNNYHDDYI